MTKRIAAAATALLMMLLSTAVTPLAKCARTCRPPSLTKGRASRAFAGVGPGRIPLWSALVVSPRPLRPKPSYRLSDVRASLGRRAYTVRRRPRDSAGLRAGAERSSLTFVLPVGASRQRARIIERHLSTPITDPPGPGLGRNWRCDGRTAVASLGASYCRLRCRPSTGQLYAGYAYSPALKRILAPFGLPRRACLLLPCLHRPVSRIGPAV